eukprot:CAMPEP_0196584822 /NCGR_PEP_ID=MMETSP1081-20130531/48603_1 /TAXON_ID=36882 /ORGANISM="Pyramimonas amylifera, Strain CCMP720" /LENGTH=83 /DNA_ID=CAMNT_0041906169 /DNA_START=455 /DNA_END=706 /DNA_ORIENTATION=+
MDAELEELGITDQSELVFARQLLSRDIEGGRRHLRARVRPEGRRRKRRRTIEDFEVEQGMTDGAESGDLLTGGAESEKSDRWQ